MRFYDNGALYSVSFNEREITDFRRRWPASGLGSLRTLWAQFEKRNGDLVDMQCNGRGCEKFDGDALHALVNDMQNLARAHFRGKGQQVEGLTSAGGTFGIRA